MISKHEQVVKTIAERIRLKRYPEESFLPSEREFTREFGVSRVTVRLGLDRLKQLGLVHSYPGRGYRVRGSDSSKLARPIRTQFIGGLFAGGKHDIMATGPMFAAISQALEFKGFHLVYSGSMDLIQNETAKARELLAKNMDGLIVQPSFRKTSDDRRYDCDQADNYAYFKDLHDNGKVIVMVDRSCAGHGIPCVCNDDVAGGYMATDYMARKGCRRIIYFGHTRGRIGYLRHKGYLDAMSDHGLTPCVHLLNHLPLISFSTNDAAAVNETRRLLAILRDETAVVTFGRFPLNLDRLTREPDYCGPPVTWIGYDFSSAGSECNPFPYVRRPMSEIGRRAAEKMLALVRGEKEAATEEFIKPEIVEPDQMTE